MKLTDLRDDNGTSLQSYVDLLAEKAQEKALRYVLIMIDPMAKERGRQDVNVVTNVLGAALPKALRGLARDLGKSVAIEPKVSPVVPS